MSRILPPRTTEEMLTTSLRMPKRLYEAIGAIAKEEGYTRTEVMLHFMEWGLVEHHREQQAEKKGGKK